MKRGITLDDVMRNIVLVCVLGVLWAYCGITYVRDNRQCNLEEAEYLCGELFHEPNYGVL